MPPKPLSASTVEAARSLQSGGLSRAAISRELGISERQVIRATQGRAPEERTGKGLSRESQEIRDSFRKQAELQGHSTKIRGNTEFQNFSLEIKDLEKSKEHLTNKEYREQRINTYWKFGLISDEQKERYLSGR